MIKRLTVWCEQFKVFWQAALGLVVMHCPAMAQASPPPIAGPSPDDEPDLGEVFGNMFYVVLKIHGLLQAIFLVTAAGLLMGAMIRYQKYKQNPVESPISSVLILLFVAIMLLIMSFIPIQTDKAQE